MSPFAGLTRDWYMFNLGRVQEARLYTIARNAWYYGADLARAAVLELKRREDLAR